MNKYGQAEYAAEILKQITEKMFSAGIITDEQKKRLDKHQSLPSPWMR